MEDKIMKTKEARRNLLIMVREGNPRAESFLQAVEANIWMFSNDPEAMDKNASAKTRYKELLINSNLFPEERKKVEI